MNKKELAKKEWAILKKEYPEPKTVLRYRSPWQLLVSTILSAQCTDVQVNKITPALFKAYPTPKKTATATQKQMESYVKTCGFFHNKAKNIIAAAKMVMKDFKGRVPQTMEELIMLPGVGRKTANIIQSSAFNKVEGIAVDTHVKRVARRLGLTESLNPIIIERDLMEVLPKKEWMAFNYTLVNHGRAICTARKAKCDICPLKKICPSAFKVSGWDGYDG